MKRDYNPFGFVSSSEDIATALCDDLTACFVGRRRPTEKELAVAFQLGFYSARNGTTEQHVLDLIEGMLWEQVDGYCEMLWDVPAIRNDEDFASLQDVRETLRAECSPWLEEAVQDYRHSTSEGHRSALLVAMMHFAGTVPQRIPISAPWSN